MRHIYRSRLVVVAVLMRNVLQQFFMGEREMTKAFSDSNRRFAMLAMMISFLLVGACASGGPTEEPLKPVQRVQLGDDTLDCDSLQGQIFEAERIVARLTQEVDGAQSSAKSQRTWAQLGSYLGQNTQLNSLAASLSDDTAREKREVRDSYQARRDTLLQQYMHKQCSVRADPVSTSRS